MKELFKIVPLFYYYIAAISVFCALLFSFKAKNQKAKTEVLYILCIINFDFYVIDDYYAYAQGNSLLTMMPLQLCNIAVFLIPFSLLLKKELIFDFIFYICVPGALTALLVPNMQYKVKPYSLMTISFFIFHYSIVAIPLLLTAWGMYKPSPTVKKALRLSISVFALAGFMHILNLIIGEFFHVNANYFFTIIKYSEPNNIAFKLLSKIIPYDFFYLLPGLIVLYIYMSIIYCLVRSKRAANPPVYFKNR